MAMWKNDDEMFALMKEKLYTPVVGDILDQMGYKHQFLPASIRPLAAQVPTAPYILPGETEDKRLRLAGYACTVLENDVYEYQAQKPFGYMTEALQLFIAFLFASRPLPRLQLNVLKGNQASRIVAERCGFHYEGTLRQAVFHMGTHLDLEMFSMLRSEAPSLEALLKELAVKNSN